MTEDKLDQILEMLGNISSKLEQQEKRICSLETKGNDSLDAEKIIIQESPREFFLKHSPKRDTDRTLVSIRFLELQKVPQITSKEIAESLAEMREKVPLNVADKIQLLDKRGFLFKSSKKEGLNCWNITDRGKKHLEELKNGRNK